GFSTASRKCNVPSSDSTGGFGGRSGRQLREADAWRIQEAPFLDVPSSGAPPQTKTLFRGPGTETRGISPRASPNACVCDGGHLSDGAREIKARGLSPPARPPGGRSD